MISGTVLSTGLHRILIQVIFSYRFHHTRSYTITIMDIRNSKFPEMCELCGAMHLHTTFSDGSVDFPALIACAKEVDLDFIVVTDHLSLKGREMGYEGFSDDLFVFVGYEHNDVDNLNHYLVLGTENVVRVHDKPRSTLMK